jgi:signal transduction histidine kinase
LANGDEILVALPSDDVTTATDQLATELALAGPVGFLALLVIVWLLLGAALRPVEALRREAAAIGGADTGRRLAVPPGADELHRLALTLNELIARLDESVRRQADFVADAAHELRSPLAGLQAQLDVAAAHPQTQDWSVELPRLRSEVARLNDLADSLLQLSRPTVVPHERVDLDDIVITEAARRRNDRIEIDTSGVEAVKVTGDAVSLSRAVANLLDNALRYADRRVIVTLRRESAEAVLIITDDGPGIPAADRGRVFDRFSRMDPARDRRAGGAGLGLAIVRRIVEDHGGTVSVTDHPDGAELLLRLPVQQHPEPAPPPMATTPPSACLQV